MPIAIPNALKFFATILLILLSNLVSAQLNVSFSTTNSTCSANGKLSITATGGQEPYIYEIIGGPLGFNRPPQSSPIFDLLPPGNYQLEVKDISGASKVLNANIVGNYKEPTLVSCDVPAGTSTATLIVKDGLSPYLYSFSTDGGGNFSVPQSSNVFSCLPNGTMVFRVTDACNNFYPCYKTVQVYEPRFTYDCAPNPLGGTDFTCKNATSPPFYYGEGNISYTAINNLGQVYTNNTGVFKGLNGCSFSINTQDQCGRNYSETNIYCGDSTFRLGVNCVNYNKGEAHIKASGGSLPYVYKEVTSGITSTNGDFTGLPKDTVLKFEIQDACGNIRSIELSPPGITGEFLGCPFNGKLQIYPPITNRTDDDTCNNDTPCRYNFFPLQIECTNCTPVQKYTINSTDRTLDFNQSFSGLQKGRYDIKISDACGNIWNQDYNLDTTNIYVLSQGDYCRNGYVKILVNDTINNTYKFYQKSPRQLITTNTTGFFTPSPNNEYYVVVENPKCKKDSFEINLKPRISATASCDSVGIFTCPDISGFTYFLYDTNGVLLQTTYQRYFKNLIQGKAYKIIAKNALFPNDTIETSFRTYEIAPFYNPTNITCSSFTIEKEPEYWSWIDHHNIPLSYSLFNGSGALVETTTVNGFDSIPPGNYTYKVSHPYCGVRQNTVTLNAPEPIQICVSPTSTLRPNSSAHEFSWLVKYEPSSKVIRVKGGPYNINIIDSSSSSTHTLNLAPGKYIIETACGNDTLDLPKTNFKLSATSSGYCPGFGKIEPSGWPTDAEWSSILNPLNYCPINSVSYELYNQYWNKVGQFTDLPSGTNYFVVMYSGKAALDTIPITSPFYARPDLSSTLGVICTGNPKAVVELSVSGGTGPYTYELLSPPLGLMYYTYDTKALFSDLAPDNYIFRVYDRCGISSDFTASVDLLNFTPQYKRLCDGKIKLQAPQILNASYEWTNAANQVVGTSYNTLINDIGAATYTVKVTSGTCVFNKTISIPAQTQADVVANAGPDFYSFTDNAQLQGNTPAPTSQKYWEQIFPSTGTTNFSDITNPISNIEVTAYPGQYTYVWTVDGGANSCIDYDTVTVTFYKCDPALNYSIQASGINTSCSVPDGKASVLATPSTGNYTYLWSNGASTSGIQNLDTGVYIVKVSDDQICTPDQYDTLKIGRNTSILNTIDVGICQGESFKVGNRFYNSSGIYKDTIVSLLGCDSIITTKLTVHPLFNNVVQKSLCIGDTLLFDGKKLTSNGTYNALLKTAYGCDSSVTLNLLFVNQIVTNLTASICYNETYAFDGKLLNQSGTYSDTSLSSLGCDSIAILNLTVNPISVVSISETICNGDIFFFNGVSLSSSGIFKDTLKNSNNCDSTVTLNLTVLSQIKTVVSDQICANQPYVFGGQNLTASGIYLDTLSSFNNCDSIVALNFTVYPIILSMIDKSICQGEYFTFNGNVLNASGQYFATFPSVDGCDSSVTLNLLVNNNSFTNLIDTICANENYVFGNITLNTSGIYKDTLATYLGCDSLVTLNLKVNQVYQKTVKDSFCVNDIYTFDTLSFSQGGSYTINYKSANYCDSIIQLELIQKKYPIIQLASDTFICRGIAVIIQINAEGGTEILWQDGSDANRYEISEAGFYSVTLKNSCGETSDTIFVADGCDGCEASIPNAFTPNGDGLNDVFKPLISCEPIEINFTIYNRWGELVYSSKSSTVGWNGTFNGSDAMTDAYVWQLDYSYEFGGIIKTKQDKGVVVLIR